MTQPHDRGSVVGGARSPQLTGAPVDLTPHQLAVVRAVILEGGQKHAAHALSMPPDTVKGTVGRAIERARSRGYRASCLTDLLMAMGWLRVPRT